MHNIYEYLRVVRKKSMFSNMIRVVPKNSRLVPSQPLTTYGVVREKREHCFVPNREPYSRREARYRILASTHQLSRFAPTWRRLSWLPWPSRSP